MNSKYQNGETLVYDDSGTLSRKIIDGVVYSPDYTVCYGLTAEMEEDSSKISKIVIKEGCKKIEISAFTDAHIEEVVLPKSLEDIANYAFLDSTVEKINLENVLHFGKEAFAKTLIEEAVINENATFDCEVTMPSGIFQNCKFLKKLTFGPKKVPCWLCNGCERLEEVSFPNGIVQILDCAFKNTLALKSFDFPEGLILINDGVFEGSAILKAEFPSSLQYIGTSAFEFASLEKIFFKPSSSPLVLSSYCFAHTNITNFTLPENDMPNLGESICANCDELISVSIDAPIQTVPRSFVHKCKKLKYVSLNPKVECLGEYSFSETGIEKIDEQFLHVKNFFEGCLQKCQELRYVNITNGLDIETNAFSECKNLILASVDAKYPSNYAFVGCNPELVILDKEHKYFKENKGATSYNRKIDPKDMDKILDAVPFKTLSKIQKDNKDITR